jgi:hypothetical protein
MNGKQIPISNSDSPRLDETLTLVGGDLKSFLSGKIDWWLDTHPVKNKQITNNGSEFFMVLGIFELSFSSYIYSKCNN